MCMSDSSRRSGAPGEKPPCLFIFAPTIAARVRDAHGEHSTHLLQLTGGNCTAKYFFHCALTYSCYMHTKGTASLFTGDYKVSDTPITTLLITKMFSVGEVMFFHFLFTHSLNHSKINVTANKC